MGNIADTSIPERSPSCSVVSERESATEAKAEFPSTRSEIFPESHGPNAQPISPANARIEKRVVPAPSKCAEATERVAGHIRLTPKPVRAHVASANTPGRRAVPI